MNSKHRGKRKRLHNAECRGGRHGSIESQPVRKVESGFTRFDENIPRPYAKGMGTWRIVAAFQEMYWADVSARLISKVTDSVIDKVAGRQDWPLDAFGPVSYLD